MVRQKNGKEGGIAFVLTYNPRLNKLGSIIGKLLLLLYINDEVKAVFTSAPFTSFGSGQNLSSYLVRAKVCPIIRKVGSGKCSRKGCMVSENVEEGDNFASSVYKCVYKKISLNCNDRCLVYLLTCKVYIM